MNWATWIPDGTQLKYTLKETEDWKLGTVIDSRIYERGGEVIHLVAFQDQSSITFSYSPKSFDKNGSQGTHKVMIT